MIQMNNVRKGKHAHLNNVDERITKQILKRAKTDGEIKLRDFDKPTQSKKSWWSNSKTKRAMERLFMQGDLMVVKRSGMEKTYALRDLILPSEVNTCTPTIEEYANYLLDNTSRSQGVFTFKQLLHLKPGNELKKAMLAALDAKIHCHEIEALELQGLPKLFVDRTASSGAKRYASAIKILSPFDKAVIHRDRLNLLFDFDFKLECYVPADKRKHGYFSLPILFDHCFVARIDCKAHRHRRLLEVKHLHLESKTFDRAVFFSKLKTELSRFGKFNQCDLIEGLSDLAITNC